jgi:hypothetical protein
MMFLSQLTQGRLRNFVNVQLLINVQNTLQTFNIQHGKMLSILTWGPPWKPTKFGNHLIAQQRKTMNLRTTVWFSDVIRKMHIHKILGWTFCARLSIPKQNESQNIKIEENAWMQKLGKRKIKTINIIQNKCNKTHASLLYSQILFHESRIFFWTFVSHSQFLSFDVAWCLTHSQLLKGLKYEPK